MIRPALLLAAAVALALPAAAIGQSEQPSGDRLDRDIILEGSARPACGIDSTNAVRLSDATLQDSGGGRAVLNLELGRMLDPTGLVQGSQLAIGLPVTCNGPHRIRVSTSRGALMREGAGSAPADFNTRLDFQVKLEFAGQTANFDTATEQSTQLNVGEAAKGNAVVTITFPPGAARLVAGAYTDILVIEVEASS